jgi:bacillithiol biosynthesis cysteine-adding enzyme BshC
MRRLALDYADDFTAVAPFFAGNPAEPDAWRQSIARAQAHPRRRTELAQLVGAQLTARDAPARAREAARTLADPQGVAIVTGQQAGLFGGPLFTLLKALTAIKLAERTARDHRVPTVAVFWIDAEDHDWDEVRACTVLDEALAPKVVSLPPRSAGAGEPIARTRLEAGIQSTIDELAANLPATEFRADLLARLAATYAPGRGMADAFARWLDGLLGTRGLVVYDCADPATKALAAPVFERELSVPGRTSRLAAEAGAALQARGYHAQTQPSDDQLALFHLDGTRRPIRHDGGRLVVSDGARSPTDLERDAREHPERFSPNVLLRPIVQDVLFPTVAYVAGPNELGYLGQLRGVYEHFGVPMPIIYPRASATLLDSAALRFLARYNVALETLQPQDDAALNALLKAQIPPLVEQAFTSAGRSIEGEMTRLIQVIPSIDPTLEGAARSTLGRMQHDLETLQGKMIQAAKRRDETLRRQYARTRALAFPGGDVQERAIGFVSFLNQYGPTLVERLDETIPLEMGRHWLIAV